MNEQSVASSHDRMFPSQKEGGNPNTCCNTEETRRRSAQQNKPARKHLLSFTGNTQDGKPTVRELMSSYQGLAGEADGCRASFGGEGRPLELEDSWLYDVGKVLKPLDDTTRCGTVTATSRRFHLTKQVCAEV